jgi:hypothetical protein
LRQIIERATQRKTLEFEWSSEQINKQEKKPKTAFSFVIGLGAGIRHDLKDCAGNWDGVFRKPIN